MVKAALVPVWRFFLGSSSDSRSKMGPFPWSITAFAFAYLLYGAWLLPVLTDWVSSAVDEGYTSYAAQRIREGEWPYRDFFFLWTPATAYLHAFLQTLGFDWMGERAASLVAACASSVLILTYAVEWKASRGDRALLMLLLFTWGFTLWNIPYSSWYAVLAALVAIRVMPKNFLLAGFCFGLAFWFKQNIGILSMLGAAAWLFFEGRRKDSFTFVFVFTVSVLLPFLIMLIFGGADVSLKAFYQIFLFPLRYPALMGTLPAKSVIAAPLTAFGLWVLSLFFLRSGSSQRSAGLLQFGLLVYIGIYAVRSPIEFTHGGLILLSVIAWPVSLFVMMAQGRKEDFSRFFLFWISGFGVFLQVIPRADFQHFLFVLPLSALLLLHALALLRERYSFLAAGWARLPVLLLALGGIFLQGDLLRNFQLGQIDQMGRISRSSFFRLNEEVAAVQRFLLRDGLKEGGPLLVLPNATAIYRWIGFRNPTPHQQFFPGYVESFGARQSDVLADYRKAGGKYLLVQERSGLEKNVPEIFAEIEREYELLKMFPENFTIYVPRSRSH